MFVFICIKFYHWTANLKTYPYEAIASLKISLNFNVSNKAYIFLLYTQFSKKEIIEY